MGYDILGLMINTVGGSRGLMIIRTRLLRQREIPDALHMNMFDGDLPLMRRRAAALPLMILEP